VSEPLVEVVVSEAPVAEVVPAPPAIIPAPLVAVAWTYAPDEESGKYEYEYEDDED
jgi:hypothetical protein